MKFEATKVGDRYVLEEMRLDGYNFGGEQSGHVIFRDFATTGDGHDGLPAAEPAAPPGGEALLSGHADAALPPDHGEHPGLSRGKLASTPDHKVKEAIDRAAQTLGRDGRIIVRPSGTEPLLRVMVEGQDEALLKSWPRMWPRSSGRKGV